jgi:hypothetical protein
VFGLVLLIPAILALAVTQALSTEILAILLGAVASYIFGRPSGGNSGGGRRNCRLPQPSYVMPGFTPGIHSMTSQHTEMPVEWTPETSPG